MTDNMLMRESERLTILDSDAPDLRASLMDSSSVQNTLPKGAKTKKILVLGLTGAGKSSIVFKFLYGFCDVEGNGIEENHNAVLKYKKETFGLTIVDVAGLDRYTTLTTNKYSLKVDGYIFVYSVNSMESFKFMHDLRERLSHLSGKYIPSILVANKCDINDRVISTEEGKKLSKAYGIPYFEVSATKNSTDVIKKVFEVMLKEILKHEARANILKWRELIQLVESIKYLVKNWDKKKIDDLCRIFFLALVLQAFIGVFFVTFAIVNMASYPNLIEHQGPVLIVQIVEGFVLMTATVIGWIGMKKENEDSIRIFSAVLMVSMIMDLGIIVLKILEPVPSPDALKQENPEVGAEYSVMDPAIYVILTITLTVLGLLFGIAYLSREIFAKRRSFNKSKFANLTV